MVDYCNSLEFTEFEEQEDWIDSALGLCSLYERKEADAVEEEEEEEEEDWDPYAERLKNFTVDEDDVSIITEFDGLALD